MIKKPVEPDYKKEKKRCYVSESIINPNGHIKIDNLKNLIRFMEELKIEFVMFRHDGDQEIDTFYFREETDNEASSRYQREVQSYQLALHNYNLEKEQLIKLAKQLEMEEVNHEM